MSARPLMTWFRPLAHCTSEDIGFDILLEANPGVVSANQLDCLADAGMSCERRIVSSSKDL